MTWNDSLRPHAGPLAILFCLWLVPLLLVGVEGEFPLSDDFAYHFAVTHWLETGEFGQLAWTYIPLYTNTMIGAFFSTLLGPGFESLRISTLCFAWIAIVGTYALALTLHAPRRMAVFAAALLAIDPLFVNLSFTFMTDVVFTAIVVWSLAAAVRGLNLRDWRWYVVALALMAIASLSRQTGVALFGGMTCALAMVARRPQRAALVAAGVAGALLIFNYGDEIGFRSQFLVKILEEPLSVRFSFIRGLSFFPAYLGGLLFPLTCLAWRSGPRVPMIAAGAASTALCLAGMVVADRWFPPGINLIYDLGLGPIDLRGTETLPTAHPAVWPIITLLGAASFGVLAVFACARLASLRREGHPMVHWIALVVFLILFFGVHLTRTPFFDRHLLPAIAVLSAALASLLPRTPEVLRRTPGTGFALAAFVPLAIFGWLGTHDYLEHHRARSAINTLVIEDGATPDTMDGGFEFQGWMNYSARWRRQSHERRWVAEIEYLVSLDDDIPGYETIATRSYHAWLANREITIYGLRETLP